MPDLSIRVDSKGIAHVDKDPNAVLDYAYRFTEWLDDDEIDTAVFPSPVAVVVDSFSIEDDDTVDPIKENAIVRAWISGGTLNSPASATCRITTIGGRVLDRTIVFKIRQY